MFQKIKQDYQSQAEKAASEGDWKTAAELYARQVEQHTSELELINSVQEGLSSKLEMQDIYDLVGDKLRDTFNAQVVMISQYDPLTRRIFHRYAIERGEHIHISGWQPIDSSRSEIIRTRKPFMINEEEIIRVVNGGTMQVVPGTRLPKTWLGVPMLVGKTAVGVVSLQNLDKSNAFSKSNIDMLVTLTNSMSQSLENARLFNETQRLLKVVEDELKIARRTQRSILPLRNPQRRGYDFGSLIMPARAVCGDFYDFIQLDQDRLGLVIADVSDKGTPAALIMALTFSLLRALSHSTDDPFATLLGVNRYLLKMNASGMFVTLLYGILDYRTGRLKYARAGHLPPIIVAAEGEVVPVEVDEGQPLGLFEDVELDVQEVQIPPGGLTLLFSDGLNEAADLAGCEFGFERIQRALSEHYREGARAICKQLWEAVNAYTGGLPLQDDFVTVVVKRI